MEVKVSNLKKSHTNFQLDIPAEIFPSGSFTALVGSNGTGKTTLLRILAGVDDRFQGEICYDGKRLNQQVRRSITMTFQTPMLLNRTVYANIEYPLKLRRLPRGERRQRVDELLAMLAIEHLAKKNATKLSGGESQKVALARALSAKPALLMLDEPFSAIDQDSINDMLNSIENYHRSSLATIILVSHVGAHVERLCDRIITM
ncbi:MAG: ATP-binding cassette domain-containing protein [Clostridiales bacterium]|nr:ATP-binding cassette domain-containing protein [Clostridiales bacterium]